MSTSNQSTVERDNIENEALASTVDFRVQLAHSAGSWERSIDRAEKDGDLYN